MMLEPVVKASGSWMKPYSSVLKSARSQMAFSRVPEAEVIQAVMACS